MTKRERIGWVAQAGLLVVLLLNAFGKGRQILGGFSLGAGCACTAATLIWWPMLCRAQRERDQWIHNAMTAKAILESLADIMGEDGDGNLKH